MKSKIKDSYYNRKPFNVALFEYILNVIVYTLILIIATKVFNSNNIYIESVWSAFLASIIINLFNITIKPFLVLVTLPITVSTLGFFYPFVNLILLKLTSILMHPDFVIKGILVPFIIVIFISVLRMIFEFLIINPIMERRK
jgi:putative membrane protein